MTGIQCPEWIVGLVSKRREAEARVAELERENARLRKALQAVRDWYERDGSVGGCSTMMEESVEPFTVCLLPNPQAEPARSNNDERNT